MQVSKPIHNNLIKYFWFYHFLYTDVLVQEATNAWIPGKRVTRFETANMLEDNSIYNGHSTPEMAGRFAAAINAQRLCKYSHSLLLDLIKLYHIVSNRSDTLFKSFQWRYQSWSYQFNEKNWTFSLECFTYKR